MLVKFAGLGPLKDLKGLIGTVVINDPTIGNRCLFIEYKKPDGTKAFKWAAPYEVQQV